MCVECELCVCDDCARAEGAHDGCGDVDQDHRHELTTLVDGRRQVHVRRRGTTTPPVARCADHQNEARSLYCLVCRATVCCVCTTDGRHVGHHTQPMGAMCKAQKVATDLLALVAMESIEQSLNGTSAIQCHEVV